jgi:hypothetical protein
MAKYWSMLWILLFYFNQAVAAEKDPCHAQQQELETLDTEIEQLQLTERFNQRARELENILRGSEGSLDAASESAGGVSEKLESAANKTEQLADKLKPVLERMSIDAAKLNDFIGETKAGVDQFKSSVDATKSKISSARGLLESAIDAANAQRGDQALEAFAKYYGQLQSILDPFAAAIPGIGSFLSAYGEAINTAAKIASELEDEVRRRNQLSQEVINTDLYLRPTSRQIELNEKLQQREQLLSAMSDAGCEPEADSTPVKPRPELSDRNREACLSRNGAPESYAADYFQAERDLKKATQTEKDLAGDIAILESDIVFAQATADNAEQRKRRIMQRYQQALRNAVKVYGSQIRFFPPTSIDSANQLCQGQYKGERFPNGDLILSNRLVQDVCTNAAAYARQIADTENQQRRIPDLQQQLEDYKQELKTAKQRTRAAQQRRDQLKQQYDAVEKCFDDETSANFNLSGIWVYRAQEYKLVQTGTSFIMLKGRDGNQGIVMRARVSGQANENKSLREAQWKYDFGASGKACNKELWVDFYNSTTYASDTIIYGRIPNYYLAGQCEVRERDTPDYINLSFKKQQ